MKNNDRTFSGCKIIKRKNKKKTRRVKEIARGTKCCWTMPKSFERYRPTHRCEYMPHSQEISDILFIHSRERSTSKDISKG